MSGRSIYWTHKGKRCRAKPDPDEAGAWLLLSNPSHPYVDRKKVGWTWCGRLSKCGYWATYGPNGIDAAVLFQFLRRVLPKVGI